MTETLTEVELITDQIKVYNEKVDGRFTYVCEYSSTDVQIALAVPAAQVVISGLELCGIVHKIAIDGEDAAYRLSILHRHSMQYIGSATARVLH